VGTTALVLLRWLVAVPATSRRDDQGGLRCRR
jgi:hypothetical protein